MDEIKPLRKRKILTEIAIITENMLGYELLSLRLESIFDNGLLQKEWLNEFYINNNYYEDCPGKHICQLG